MSVYMIGYDLHKGEFYDDLISSIKTLGSWWHCLDSTWLVDTQMSAKEIKTTLRRHIRNDDQILVIKYGSGASWYGFGTAGEPCQDWLKNHL